jgi:UDP-glucose 4-epimerase
MNYNIIITGGCGFIGSCLVKNLSNKYNITILDKKKPTLISLFKKNINFINLNLCSRKNLFKIISKIQPKTIIHLAAQSTIDMVKIKKNSYIKNNIESTKNIVDACVKFNIRKLIFSSTAAVYKKKTEKLGENSKIFSNNIYGKTKIINEQYIKRNLSKTNYGILRFFNVCSSDKKNRIGEMHSPETHLLPIIINKIQTNKLINIYGKNYKTKDGTCVRDYVHVKDVVDGIIKLNSYLDNNKSETINLGSGVGYSVLNIIKACEKIMNIKSNFKFIKKRFGDSSSLICSIRKAKQKLKWIPKFSNLEKIIYDEIWWQQILKKNNIKRKFIY